MASKFHARDRRKSLYDPSFELFRTHTFAPDATGILTGAVFPSRVQPITVAVTVRRTGATPQGIIFELGSALTGLALWFDSTDGRIYAGLGNATVGGTFVTWVDTDVVFLDGDDVEWFGGTEDGEGLTLQGPAPPIGQKLRIVLSTIPSVGKARLWVNGDLVAADGVVGGFPNGWSDTGPGAVADLDTDVTTRVALADRVALTDAEVISPVTVFHKQRPRQFFEVA